MIALTILQWLAIVISPIYSFQLVDLSLRNKNVAFRKKTGQLHLTSSTDNNNTGVESTNNNIALTTSTASTTSTPSTTTSKGIVRPTPHRICRARDLMKSLIEEDLCYTTEAGARKFSEVCAVNCIYEDRYEPQPIIGKIAIQQHMIQKVQQRYGGSSRSSTLDSSSQSKMGYRIDKISDGNQACGFAWTWTCQDQEGLRGTTFVELNEAGEIQYISEVWFHANDSDDMSFLSSFYLLRVLVLLTRKKKNQLLCLLLSWLVVIYKMIV
jgi:hypothetical protein